MSRQPEITQAEFDAAARALQEAGREVTNRSVQSLTGGSFTTICPLVRRWKLFQASEPANHTINSTAAMRALKRFIAEETVAIHASLRAQVDDGDSLNEDLAQEVDRLLSSLDDKVK